MKAIKIIGGPPSRDERRLAEALIKAGVDPNQSAEGGKPPLILAMEKGYGDVVVNLLDSGADPKGLQIDGKPLLVWVLESDKDHWWSPSRDERRVAEALIKAGVDPNQSAEGSKPPLILAMEKGYGDFVISLLGSGADPKGLQIDGQPLLVWVLESDKDHWSNLHNKHYYLVEALIKAGVDPNQSAEGGKPPLILAMEKGFVYVVRSLLRIETDLNKIEINDKLLYTFAADYFDKKDLTHQVNWWIEREG